MAHQGEGSSTPPEQHTPNTTDKQFHQAQAQSIARGVVAHLCALADHHQEVASRYDALA